MLASLWALLAWMRRRGEGEGADELETKWPGCLAALQVWAGVRGCSHSGEMHRGEKCIGRCLTDRRNGRNGSAATHAFLCRNAKAPENKTSTPTIALSNNASPHSPPSSPTLPQPLPRSLSKSRPCHRATF